MRHFKTEAILMSEQAIFEGKANLQRNVETVGGILLLFESHLVFEPHKINVQRKNLDIPLKPIRDVHFGWTKLLGFIPIFPNAIMLTMENGDIYRFTVFSRNTWREKILSAAPSLA